MNTKYLAGIVDLPYTTPAGRLVSRTGHDPETSLYLNMPMDWQVSVPDSPTGDDVRAALRVIAQPFSAYRFAEADGAAGMVSGVFAAGSRLVMDLCPAYLFDSASPGSGKTKAATALGAIIQGERVGVTPFSGTSTDDELRKRLTAGAMAGTRFHCVDNVVGHWKSSVMAAVLTSGKLSDRVLGQSKMMNAHVRSLITLSANNASLWADLQRRTVQVRIDSGANPTHRAFAHDPVTLALVTRRQIAEAVCTVQRAYFAAGAPDTVSGDAGGFADWNRLVRQPVLWLIQQGYDDALPWSLQGADPAASMLRDASEGDPEIEALGDLLIALNALSEGGDFTSNEALSWFQRGRNDPDTVEGQLHSAVLECVGKPEINARGIAKVLTFRRDRVVGGLKLLVRASGRLKSWRVVQQE